MCKGKALNLGHFHEAESTLHWAFVERTQMNPVSAAPPQDAMV